MCKSLAEKAHPRARRHTHSSLADETTPYHERVVSSLTPRSCSRAGWFHEFTNFLGYVYVPTHVELLAGSQRRSLFEDGSPRVFRAAQRGGVEGTRSLPRSNVLALGVGRM